jgi:phosphoribosyl 1,2-cyclic phosphate phosphodiesterase
MGQIKMRVNVLGCGTSTGVPLIHCTCAVCTSTDPRNKRLRASVWVEIGGKSILIDCGPDFRQQALRAHLARIDAILFTHPHFDHIAGVDEIRSYNFVQKETIPAFAHPWTYAELLSRYAYIFKPQSYAGKIEGGGAASITLHEFQLNDQKLNMVYAQAMGLPSDNQNKSPTPNLGRTATVDLTDAENSARIRVSPPEVVTEDQSIEVIPIAVDHGSQKIAGYRIGNFAYLTDCSHVPEESFAKLNGLDVLMLDCLRMSKHETHLSLEEALKYSARINAKMTYFTHLSHDFDYAETSRILPKNHALAYDEMIITIGE